MRRQAVLLAALACCPAYAAEPAPVAGVPDETTREVRELLRLTGSEDLGRQVMLRMLEIQKDGKSARQREVLDRFATKLDIGELQDKLVRLYAEHFTADEIRALNAFFRSPAGRKYVGEMPAMLQQAMSIGEAWALDKARELNAELAREAARPTSL